MAQYSKIIPKGAECDESLIVAIDAIMFFTRSGDTLVDYRILTDSIMLVFARQESE